MNERRSPWWYRLRPMVFGAIYFTGFFLGNVIDGSLHAAPRPTIVVLGSLVNGDLGILVLLWLAVAAIFAGWLVRVWGSAYLRPETVWNADALDDRLIVAGPFRYVRNPLYFATILLALGFGSFAPPAGFAIVLIGNIVLVYGLIAEERALMSARYGETFDRFVRAVPALIPRLRPATVAGATIVTPSYAAGFRSEVFFGALGFGSIALAVGGTSGLPIFFALAIVGYVLRFVLTRSRAAKARP